MATINPPKIGTPRCCNASRSAMYSNFNKRKRSVGPRSRRITPAAWIFFGSVDRKGVIEVRWPLPDLHIVQINPSGGNPQHPSTHTSCVHPKNRWKHFAHGFHRPFPSREGAKGQRRTSDPPSASPPRLRVRHFACYVEQLQTTATDFLDAHTSGRIVRSVEMSCDLWQSRHVENDLATTGSYDRLSDR